MKKILVSVILSVFVLSHFLIGAQAETLLRLPVRVFSGDTVYENLTQEDFSLLINGEKKEIIHFLKMNRSLSSAISARNFVLSFYTRNYTEQIAEGISYFVNHVLNERDSLLVWSPVKVYALQVTSNKDQLIQSIQSIIKKDSLLFKNDLANGYATFNEIIKKYKSETEESKATVDQASPVGTTRTIAHFFMANYTREIKNYKERFILPNIIMNKKIAELLAAKNGPKYIINFQERDIIPYFAEYQKIATEIQRLAETIAYKDASTSNMMYKLLDVLEKSMLISENLPKQEIVSAFWGSNICYNVILFKNAKERTTLGDIVPPDIDNTFAQMAKLTGGAAVTNDNLTEALDKIRSHTDNYYELIFKIDSLEQDKQIALDLTKKTTAQLYYKGTVTKEEVQSIFGTLNQSRIQLTGVNLDAQHLKFSISGYQLNTAKDNDHGIIKVQINLFDQDNTLIYKSQKTLEAQGNSIDFALDIPSKYTGDFTLSINAVDMVSMKSTQFNQIAKL